MSRERSIREGPEEARMEWSGGANIDRRENRHPGNASLRAAFPLLVDEWREYWQQQPWHQTVQGAAPDTLIEVLRAVLDAAMVEDDIDRVHQRLLHAALAHGEQRRADGVSDEALLGEYHALRKALWRYLLRSVPPAEGLTTILRVDVVMSAASGLALRGYMRSSIEPTFPWEQELARTMATASAGLSRALSLSCREPLGFERACSETAMRRETVRLKDGPLDGVAIVIGDGVEVIDGSALVEATRPDTETHISTEAKDGRAHRITIRTNEADIVYERTTDGEMTYQGEDRHA